MPLIVSKNGWRQTLCESPRWPSRRARPTGAGNGAAERVWVGFFKEMRYSNPGDEFPAASLMQRGVPGARGVRPGHGGGAGDVPSGSDPALATR